MWIIVTGPDKAGKSTLCEQLGYHLLKPPMKCTHNIDHLKLEQITNKHIKMFGGDTVLWDRWHYPEDIIYGAIVEHRPSVLSFQTHILETDLFIVDAHFIHVTAEPADLIARYNQSKDDYLSMEQLLSVKTWYDRFMKMTTIPVCHINSSWCTPEEMVTKALDYIRRNER